MQNDKNNHIKWLRLFRLARYVWIKFDLLFARKLGKRSELSQVVFVSSKHYTIPLICDCTMQI